MSTGCRSVEYWPSVGRVSVGQFWPSVDRVSAKYRLSVRGCPVHTLSTLGRYILAEYRSYPVEYWPIDTRPILY